MTFSNTGLDKNKYAFLHIFTEDKIIENQSLGKKFTDCHLQDKRVINFKHVILPRRT